MPWHWADATRHRVAAESVALTPHKNGPGFSIQLRALPIDGRIVLLPPDTGDEQRNKDR